jgi:hypothetical protein
MAFLAVELPELNWVVKQKEMALEEYGYKPMIGHHIVFRPANCFRLQPVGEVSVTAQVRICIRLEALLSFVGAFQLYVSARPALHAVLSSASSARTLGGLTA